MSKAKKDQGSDFYPGVDDWKPYTLKAGDTISQLDFRSPEAIKIQQRPASNYFTTGDISITTEDNKPSARDFSEQVQVKPFRVPFAKEHSYQPYVTVYQVKRELQVESARVENNPLYGRGGATQFFVANKDELVKEGYLELKHVLPTLQHDHNLSVFKKAEAQKLNNEQILKLVKKEHEQLIKDLEKGTPADRVQASQMRKLMQESKELREGKEIDTTSSSKQFRLQIQQRFPHLSEKDIDTYVQLNKTLQDKPQQFGLNRSQQKGINEIE